MLDVFVLIVTQSQQNPLMITCYQVGTLDWNYKVIENPCQRQPACCKKTHYRSKKDERHTDQRFGTVCWMWYNCWHLDPVSVASLETWSPCANVIRILLSS